MDHHHAKSKSNSQSNLSESPGSTVSYCILLQIIAIYCILLHYFPFFQPTVGSPRGAHQNQQQQNPIHNPTKSENRVHFDLNHSNSSGGVPSDIRKPARSTPRTNTSSRPNNIHLPSDARQRLEQLVSPTSLLRIQSFMLDEMFQRKFSIIFGIVLVCKKPGH